MARSHCWVIVAGMCETNRNEEMGFFIEERKMMILGSILPRADRPARWDLPGGNLVDMIASMKKLSAMNLEKIVPMTG